MHYLSERQKRRSGFCRFTFVFGRLQDPLLIRQTRRYVTAIFLKVEENIIIGRPRLVTPGLILEGNEEK